MATARKKTGNEGEMFACNYLQEKKWKILGKNMQLPWNDEIDIIARDNDGVLVFVEVKTVTGNFLKAEDQMTNLKIKKCIRAATWYANYHSELINEKVGWRIDCVALKKVGDTYEIHHYQQIV